MLRTSSSNEARVLLYCHGDSFDIDKHILEVLDVSYKLIDKTTPKKIESINIDPKTNPTIISTDGNLPSEFLSKFNVVVDYNCDHTGWAVSEKNFYQFTVPLYKNMVSALDCKQAFCFITSFQKDDFAMDEKLKERIKLAEDRRSSSIELLLRITTELHVEKVIIESRKNYIIFFGVQK